MSDIKLFRFSKNNAEELAGRSALVERELHELMEKHMECFLGIRFVAHEYSTGKNHRGRIDSLGLDENCCPVIIEYKRQTHENIINQGLYYLDWLLDHQAEFKLLIMKRYGKDEADSIEWGGTRVLCMAGDFTKYDEHAVAQIDRNIELIRYKYFADDLLLLELLNPVQEKGGHRQSAPVLTSSADEAPPAEIPSKKGKDDANTFAEHFTAMSAELRLLYDELFSFVMSLGDDINAKELRRYLAFSRLKNFVCLLPLKGGLKLWMKLDPATVQLAEGFSRDVSQTGHWGTGDLEVYIRNNDDFAKAKPLIERAYQEN
jgi:predicted transport protein